MLESALEIKKLYKSYASSKKNMDHMALKGIDLQVPAGKIFGLLGPNGAGKSTLINILAGLVLKTKGSVKIWGFDQDENPRQSRAAIGVMPQELNLDPFFTPRAALDVQAGLYGIPKNERKSDAILELVGLSDKAEAYSRTLSGGMRRRLLLAKALVHRPQVLVLDEPTAGVDLELRQMLWHNMRKLNEEYGTTIILTTHYLEEAEKMCEELAILDHGQIVARDKTKNLLAQLDRKSLIIKTTIGSPEFPKNNQIDSSIRDDGRLVLSYSSSKITAGDVLELLRQASIGIEDVKTVEADLKDVFFKMTSSKSS
ncbi:MAG: multidrug ABC transporter ATP-binding protein [Aestuariivita sp.]|nr:multidrug ABC transporter ATP-binding protein [Aestuariivita sp.]